jgi:hypothetical protein
MTGWKSLFNRRGAKEPTWKDARRDFFKAIRRQDTDRMSAIAAQYPEALEWENEDGSPLFIAMNANKFKSFCKLADLGAKINNSTLIFTAAKDGKSNYVEYMLERGVPSNSNAEIYARAYKHFEILDMLKRAPRIRQEFLARENAGRQSGNGQINIRLTVTKP